MPDADHAPAFWASVAATFRADPDTLFDLFNEPAGVGWDCWRDGCLDQSEQPPYRAAGMVSLLAAVRGAQAHNPVLLGGLAYANQLDGWLSHRPSDPDHALLASWHVYDGNPCVSEACWNRDVAPVARQVPVIAGEVGLSPTCSTALPGAALSWLDRHQLSYLAWTWNAWGDCGSLVADSGAAPTAWALMFRAHLAALPHAPPSALDPAPRQVGAAAAGDAVGAMPLISRDLPAYSTDNAVYPGAQGNDGDYPTQWRAAPSSFLAYDVSSVPAAQRRRVVVVWYNEDTGAYDHTLVGELAYNVPRSYTIEANAAPGGAATPPSTGWATLATVAGNRLHSRQHVVDLGGANWIRMRITDTDGNPPNTDAALNLDVHDASRGHDDDWIFFGDSITAGAMGHDGSPTFAQQVHAAVADSFPVQENGGIGGVNSAFGAAHVRSWLSTFPGRYVSLAYGTNDALQDVPVEAFSANLQHMVQAVLAAGKVPVVPTIPWGCEPRIVANGPGLNAAIQRLYRAYPEIIHGPDLWQYFAVHRSLISGDCIHPNAAGMAAYRAQYAQDAVERVYHGPRRYPPRTAHLTRTTIVAATVAAVLAVTGGLLLARVRRRTRGPRRS
jgi:lysophospholipase L1-like esterase